MKERRKERNFLGIFLVFLAAIVFLGCPSPADNSSRPKIKVFEPATREVLPVFTSSGTATRGAKMITPFNDPNNQVTLLYSLFDPSGEMGYSPFNFYGTVGYIDMKFNDVYGKDECAIAPITINLKYDLDFNGKAGKATYDYAENGIYARLNGNKYSVLVFYSEGGSYKSVTQAYLDKDSGNLEMAILNFWGYGDGLRGAHRIWVEGNTNTHSFKVKILGRGEPDKEKLPDSYDFWRNTVGRGISKGAGNYMLFGVGGQTEPDNIGPIYPAKYLPFEPSEWIKIPAVATLAELKNVEAYLKDIENEIWDALKYEWNTNNPNTSQGQYGYYEDVSVADTAGYMSEMPAHFEKEDMPSIDEMMATVFYTGFIK